MQVKAHGDIHIDDHHTNEDVALAIGTVNPFYKSFFFSLFILSFVSIDVLNALSMIWQTLLKALGDRKGINRFGDFTAPLDEALVHVSLVQI